jgi:transposase
MPVPSKVPSKVPKMSAAPPLPFLGPIRFPPRPWAPLSDAEYEALRPILAAPPGRRGRKPENLRRTLDAVFWIAASTRPWRALPPELGKPNSVARALRRWARAGLLSVLLARAVRRDAAPVLRGLAYWLCRAFRRMAKLVGTLSMRLVRDVLRLVDAWPANPLHLPDRNLSQRAKAELDRLGIALKTQVRHLGRADPPLSGPALHAATRATLGCIRAIRAGWRLMRLGVLGNRHEWKLR